MKSTKVTLYLYVLIACMVLRAVESRATSSQAIKKGKRLQGLLTQSVPPSEIAQEQKSIATEIDAAASTSQPKPEEKTVSSKSENSPGKKVDTAKGVPKTGEITEKKEASNALPTPTQSNKTIPTSLLTPKRHDKPSLVEQKKSIATAREEVPSIEFHFENTDLQNVVAQIAEIFDVTFITDDMISPLQPGAKTLKGNKISFKTQKALSRKDAWALFLSFLDLAGFAATPQDNPPTRYKILPIETAQRSALRSFIGVDPGILPNNDEMIRYVYFVENSSLDTIKGIIETLKSSTAPFQILQESKAFILTDKAYNIKSLMQIVQELDKVNLPQTLSVLKLRRADAAQVKELYDTLSNSDDKNIAARLFPARKQPTSLYFPENTRIFAEPRTNTLILLGPQDAITKIEDFITKYIDVDQDKPYSPLKVYTLKYADAEAVASIMNNVTIFGQNTEAGRNGGVRGEDKYLKSMSFTPEKSTNRIIIRGDYEDYLKAVEIIAKLDEPQPQVAMELLIIEIDLNDSRSLGTQLRSKIPATGLTNSPKFQTSGLYGQGIVENPTGSGVQKLLGNLLSLITSAGTGNTVVSLGTDAYGVWGVFSVLESIASAQVVSNPFLTTTNKTAASVSLGSTRRVQTATVVGSTNQASLGDLKAALTVKITPQINSDGMITLDLNIQVDDFVDATNPSSATTNNRNITTNAIVADREVLAVGGLIQTRTTDNTTKVPILGDIPILGWLFKNKQKVETKSNLLVLVSTRIINPERTDISGPATQERANEYRNDLASLEEPSDRHDPVTKLFFGAGDTKTHSRVIDDFIFKRHGNSLTEEDLTTKEMSRQQRKKLARKQKKLARLKQQEEAAFANASTKPGLKEVVL